MRGDAQTVCACYNERQEELADAKAKSKAAKADKAANAG